MSENLTIQTERVDDVPLLLAQMERMGVPSLLDAHFPVHGNRQGLSLGWLSTIWLAHILSQADHRLNQVRPWAETLCETLHASLPTPLRPTDLTDDRLADVLRALSDDTHWAAFEGALNAHTLRVYDLRATTVRVDSTTASGYWNVTEEGLFQFGHSKDHRPDLPQVKVMLATLDPLGMPLAVDVVAGQSADDPLYLPVITRVRASLGRTGLLYVGDCKLAALLTRAQVHIGGDYYLCPLPSSQDAPEWVTPWLERVLADPATLTPVMRNGP
jgi:transposase